MESEIRQSAKNRMYGDFSANIGNREGTIMKLEGTTQKARSARVVEETSCARKIVLNGRSMGGMLKNEVKAV